MPRELGLRNAADLCRPYCAKCGGGKVVEEMEILRNHLRLTYEFIVRCHGETERCTLGDEFFLINRDGIDRGWAFGPKPELPEPQKLLTEDSEHDQERPANRS